MNRAGIRNIKKHLQQATKGVKELTNALQQNLEGNFKIRCAPTGAPLSHDMLSQYSDIYHSEEKYKYTSNALASTPITWLAENRNFLKSVNYAYSHTLLRVPKATSQDYSGRCWMFAALNSMRYYVIKNLNLGDSFELSEAFLFFYDKIERAYFFLENMVNLRNNDINDMTVYGMMSFFQPMEDGGTWSFLCNLVKKYGIVPKTCYGENFNSSSTSDMNEILYAKLAEYANTIRSSKFSDDHLRKNVMNEMMPEFYSLITQFMGEPPKTFDWSYHEVGDSFEAVRSKGTYHHIENLTPQDFFEGFINPDFRVDKKIVLRNDPRATSEYYKTYSVQNFGSMVGGQPEIAFNVPMEVMKAAAANDIMNDKPVWFSCDVGKCFVQDKSLLATEAYQYENVLHTSMDMDRDVALNMRVSQGTHAMSLVAVDLEGGDPSKSKKWRIENSWGEANESDDPGYLQMTDAWFDKYVYDVVVDMSSLPDEIQAIYLKEQFTPIYLEYNDPFGAVAMLKRSPKPDRRC